MRAVILLLAFLVIAPDPAHAADPKKVDVESIDFAGNERYSDKQLRGLMAVRTSGLIRKSFYDPRVFQDDLENIRRFYVDEGYLDGRIAAVNIDSTGNTFRIRITVSEGERTFVDAISFSGNTFFPDTVLFGDIPLKPGGPLLGQRIRDGVANIMVRYGRDGYLGAVVTPDVRVNPDVHRAHVGIVITEGRRYTVQDIRVLGLVKTKGYVVTREIPLERGDVFDYTALFRAERNLWGTGLFNGVIVQPAPAADDSSERIVLVRVRERKSGEFAVGGGYESIEGLRGTLSVQNNNLYGTARSLGFAGQISQAGYRARVGYSQPWTLGIRLRTDVNTLYEFREETAFNVRRYGGNLVFGRAIRRYTNANITFRAENIRIGDIKVESLPDSVERGRLRSVGFGIIYDTRDNVFDTVDGAYIDVRNEMVGILLGGTDDFVRTVWTARLFNSPWNRMVAGGALQVGWQGVYNAVRSIPLSERFYAGGPNSVRGFGYQELGPLDAEGNPIGGRFILVGNLELRVRVFSIVGMAFFFDAGNVWDSAGDFRFGDIRTSAGLGPRVSTPFGVVRTEFAFKLDRRAGEKLNQFWFALGQAF